MKIIKTIIAIICGIAAGRIVADPDFGTAAEIAGVVFLIFCAAILLFSVEQKKRYSTHELKLYNDENLHIRPNNGPSY